MAAVSEHPPGAGFPHLRKPRSSSSCLLSRRDEGGEVRGRREKRERGERREKRREKREESERGVRREPWAQLAKT